MMNPARPRCHRIDAPDGGEDVLMQVCVFRVSFSYRIGGFDADEHHPKLASRNSRSRSTCWAIFSDASVPKLNRYWCFSWYVLKYCSRALATAGCRSDCRRRKRRCAPRTVASRPARGRPGRSFSHAACDEHHDDVAELAAERAARENCSAAVW